ncbi:MAG: hypothetical protein Q9159_004104, partial [Coniocarpon cinnabarinum]
MENGLAKHPPQSPPQTVNNTIVQKNGTAILDLSQTAEASAKSKKEDAFKSSHRFLIAFLTLLIVLKGIAVYLFTSGFLLTRLVLESKAECNTPPIHLASSYTPGTVDSGCWHPKAFDKAVVIIIDALRYDFTVPFQADQGHDSPRHFHGGIPLLHDLAVSQPENAVLLPFIADPPTTTLQRLKGLTTGTLPTFVDAGSNFAGTAIDEDNLIAQLLKAEKSVVHLGDDTWHSLFPGYFEPELTRPFDSFNVWDLHTVDNGVTTHLLPLLQPSNASRWDVIFGHYLGVDHAGHRYGPDHPAMQLKLQQMNAVLTRVIELLDPQTLLVVMGDHGMDSKGDHGGESDDEVEAALWMYSKTKRFGRMSKDTLPPPPTAKERPVNQIDLVPTLALLLGLPIPFNNLGAPIREAFIGPKGNDYQSLASVNALTSAQTRLYQNEYAAIRKPDAFAMAEPNRLYLDAFDSWSSRSLTTSWRDMAQKFADYQASNLRVCKDLWARFDLVGMAEGIVILILAFANTLGFASCTQGDLTKSARRCLLQGLLGGGAGVVIGITASVIAPSLGLLQTTSFAFALCISLTIFFNIYGTRDLISSLIPHSVWSQACCIFTLLTAVGFGSNSFTIWEDETSLFFLASSLLLALSAVFRLASPSHRHAALAHVFVILTSLRLASLSRLCRDEQMPYCRTTFYASSTTTTSAPWQLFLSWIVALTLPQTIKSFYQRSQNYTASAPFWVGFAFQAALFLISCYWTLDAADDGNWLAGSRLAGLDLKSIRMYIAQFILMIAAGAGSATFAWMAPCFGVERGEGPDGNSPQLVLHGTSNLYGSQYAVLPLTVMLIPLLLVQKPMGQLALALTSLAILSFLELLTLLQKVPRTRSSSQRHTTSSPQASTSLPTPSAKQLLESELVASRPPPSARRALTTVFAPTFFAFLAHFAFFKTGHQAALASIQWDSAFVPLRTIRYPWAPLMVLLNTFGAQILGALVSVSGVLWGRPYKFVGLSPHNNESDTVELGPNKTAESNVPSRGEEPDARHKDRREILSDCTRALLTHTLVYGALNLA